MAYDNLDPNDTMIVNRGSNSYSVTVDQVSSSSPVLQDNDVFLVNRGDKSFSVTKKIITDEIGKEGEITAPVVVLTPPNGAGLGDTEVTPAAEGVTGVVESQDTFSAWNQDQTWSNAANFTLSGQNNNNIENIFNGNVGSIDANPSYSIFPPVQITTNVRLMLIMILELLKSYEFMRTTQEQMEEYLKSIVLITALCLPEILKAGLI